MAVCFNNPFAVIIVQKVKLLNAKNHGDDGYDDEVRHPLKAKSFVMTRVASDDPS
jgi:hypothetical protein